MSLGLFLLCPLLATAQDVTFSPTSLSWGAVQVGVTSGAKPVTVTNTQSAALTISSISVPAGADFLVASTTCPLSPSTLAAGANCSVSVQFRPLAQGTRMSALTIADDAPSQTQSLSLSGTATIGPLLFSPTSLSFNTALGTTSAAQTDTLTNTLSSPITLSNIKVSAQFGQTNNCPVSPSTLAGGASCSFSVTFSPTTAGPRSSGVTLSYNTGTTNSGVQLYLAGSTAVNTLSLTPSSFNFKGVTVGTASGPASFTLTNDGSQALTVSSISTNTGDFSATSNCPLSPNTLAGGANCTISVTFKPSNAGPESDTLSVLHNGSNSPVTAALSGTGMPADTSGAVTFSPASLSWGNVQIGLTSGAKSVTLTNTQTVPLTISSLSLGSEFRVRSTTCPLSPATVPAGGTCTISVVFMPLAQGPRSDMLAVNDDGPASPQTVALSGPGIVGPLLFSPSSLTFQTQPGTTSAMQIDTLTNTLSTPLTLSNINIGSQFAQNNNCPVSPSTLAGGASCTFNVTFNPGFAENVFSAINVTYTNGSTKSTPQLFLTGSSVANPIALTPSSTNFNNVPVGTASAPATFTLTNNGSQALTLSSIATKIADYAPSSNCPVSPSTLASGANCTISVTFTPSSVGPSSDTLTVTHNAAGSPATAALSGTGTAVMAGSVTFAPTSLAYPNTQVGQTSATKSVTLTNNQSVALTISSIASGNSDYTVTGSTCPTSPSALAANGTCTISVAFAPQSSGSRPGTISVTDDGPASPQQAELSGTGTTAVGSVTFAPTSLAYPNTQVGQTSATKSVTLTNNQSSALTISSIVSGNSDYTVIGTTCPTSPSTVAANGTCTISAAFAPQSSGPRPGTISVTDDGPASPQQVGLSGTGTTAVGSVTFSPTSLAYPNTQVGQTSATKSVTLTNNQSSALTISSIAVGTSDYQVTATTCATSPATIAANGTCTITVAFTPTAQGSRPDKITVTDDGPASPQQAALSGTGTPAGNGSVTLSPKQYTFPTQSKGTTATKAITLTNGQAVALAISNIQISAPYSQTNNCGSSVAAGNACTITVTYAPTAVGFTSTNLVITDDASSSPQSAAISGNAQAAVSTIPANPGAHFFNQIVKTTSTPLNITLINNQNINLTINSITSTTDYPFTTGCVGSNGSGTLAPQASCVIAISFDPQAIGSRPATMLVSESADANGISIPLAGTGIAGDAGLTVTVGPSAPCIFPSGTQQFTAYVTGTNNTAVTWYVDGKLNGSSTVGTIDSSGLYTAPNANGTSHTIRAASQASPNVAGNMIASITSTPSVFAIYPFTTSLPPAATQTFQAQVCYVPDSRPVTFSVDNIPGGNSSVGTITSAGVYTAPLAAGRHLVRVTDATLNKTSGAVATVFSTIAVDFGSRTNTAHPIPANMLGAGRGDSLQNAADRNLVAQAGVAFLRLYGQIPLVYATQTPDWTKVDTLIAPIQAAGQHVLLQLSYSPPWLQPNPNPCGTGNSFVAPSDINAWGQIAASYVAHMDAAFPGTVKDYEIWNEPNAGGLCTSDHLNTYLAIYAAAAAVMKQQAATDGVTIHVGGPVLSGYSALWISNLTTNASTAPYVDFISYHEYFYGPKGLQAQWDTYNSVNSLYQEEQDPSVGVASNYTKVYNTTKVGKQPLGANTPIYITEFNTNYAFLKDCCRNDPTYAPLWNALYVSDLLNTAYSGLPSVTQIDYFASSAYPYFCLVGILDQNLDCNYPEGSSPQPYPQYYAFQLLSSNNYLGLVSGGFMAASVTPPLGAGGLAVTAFYNASQDAIVIINPTPTAYTQIPVSVLNAGFTTPNATLYKIVNGASISSTSVPLTAQGKNWSVSVDVPAYSVQAISLKGQ